jgi:DNA-binding response OmpR family regulator
MTVEQANRLEDPLRGSIQAVQATLMIVGSVECDAGPNWTFDQGRWRICRAPDCRGFRKHAVRQHPRVVLCEQNLRDGSWKDVLSIATGLRYAPPVIVTSRLADEHLWAEVLNLGGYDVLAKPFERDEVSRTLDLAWHRADVRRVLVERAG